MCSISFFLQGTEISFVIKKENDANKDLSKKELHIHIPLHPNSNEDNILYGYFGDVSGGSRKHKKVPEHRSMKGNVLEIKVFTAFPRTDL